MRSPVSCTGWEVSILILTCPTRRCILTRSTTLTPCWKPSRRLERMLPTSGRSLHSSLAWCEELGIYQLYPVWKRDS
ncbi:hypothetical protein RLOC_00006735 [Lonchura striata]|uniref:Uncharacterized protein n=1 Tax=Lonchura striata TaxID=40157 RepID=A0A218V0M9_9PASE|nr:hypothetical protein RLOC_00006735 [Lonchura striata domestica]